MQIKGVPMADFNDIVNSVSSSDYEHNVIVHPDSRDENGVRAPRIQARLRCVSSGHNTHGDDLAPGAKRGFSGRRGTAACWHAYRDVLTELFNRFPNAVVRTAMAHYKGQDGFNENYPDTAYINVGSAFQPMYAKEMCEC